MTMGGDCEDPPATLIGRDRAQMSWDRMWLRLLEMCLWTRRMTMACLVTLLRRRLLLPVPTLLWYEWTRTACPPSPIWLNLEPSANFVLVHLLAELRRTLAKVLMMIVHGGCGTRGQIPGRACTRRSKEADSCTARPAVLVVFLQNWQQPDQIELWAACASKRCAVSP